MKFLSILTIVVLILSLTVIQSSKAENKPLSFNLTSESDFPINIDGSLEDWVYADISPIIRDIEGDSSIDDLSQDIKEVYSVSYDQYIYIGISLYGSPRMDKNIEYCFWFDLDRLNGDDFFVGLNNGYLWYYQRKIDGSFSKIEYIYNPIFSIKNAVEIAIPLNIFPYQVKYPYMHIWIHNYKFGNKPIDITYGSYIPRFKENPAELHYYVDCSRLNMKECIVKVNINNLNQKEVIFSSKWYRSFLGHALEWPFEYIEVRDGEEKINIDEFNNDGVTYIKIHKKDKSPIKSLVFVYKKKLNKKYIKDLNFYFGYITDHEYTDSTGYLFLEPLNVYLNEKAFITFENVPKGWKVFTIWDEVSDNVVSVPLFEEIFDRNAFVMGDCEVANGKEGDMNLEVVFPKGTDKSIINEYLTYMLKTMDYMRNIWKCEPYTGSVYLSVVTPKIGDGAIVGAEANRSDMIPFMSINDFIQEFSHHLFHTRNGFSPCGFRISDSSRWFLEGTNVFYNKSKVQFAAKLDITNKKIKELYKEYLSEIYGTPKDFPISYNTAISGPKIFYDKGALVSFLLDYKIKEVTNGKKSLDDLLPIIYEKYSPCAIMNCLDCYKIDPNIPIVDNRVLIRLLNDLTGYDFDNFFHKYVYGKEKLNLEEYFTDTDGDGLSDIDEKYLGTNPNESDTDEGGIGDGEEVIKGQDPLNSKDDFSYDKYPPKITLVYPKDNTWINQEKIVIIVIAQDKESGMREVIIGDTQAALKENGIFEKEITLSEGENKIKIEAYDKAGNKQEKTLTVYLDKTPPELSVNIPDEVNDPDLTITGSVNDNLSGIKYLKINEEDITISPDGSFSYTLTLNEGENTITFELEDKAGNKIDKTFTVNYTKRITLKLQIGSKTMYINDEPKEIDVPPTIVEGRTLLPIRWVAEPLGADVSWDGKERKVIVSLNDTTIELWIGKPTARVNGIEKPIDPNNPKVVPMILNGRTMLPVRFVAENLGADVHWDGTTKTVTIIYPKE